MDDEKNVPKFLEISMILMAVLSVLVGGIFIFAAYFGAAQTFSPNSSSWSYFIIFSIFFIGLFISSIKLAQKLSRVNRLSFILLSLAWLIGSAIGLFQDTLEYKFDWELAIPLMIVAVPTIILSIYLIFSKQVKEALI